ncbi:hypothetical protein TNCV_1870861 [Trichonephila clavipes]|nr:hypothetical protein TNCV_1870861 [Trichonephila clavipes]
MTRATKCSRNYNCVIINVLIGVSVWKPFRGEVLHPKADVRREMPATFYPVPHAHPHWKEPIVNARGELDMPLVLKRAQFPARLEFATTINKSHAQSFEKVGLCVTSKATVLAHGQLIVWAL